MCIPLPDELSRLSILKASSRAKNLIAKMGSQESKTFKAVATTFEKGDFIEKMQNKYNLQPQKPTVVEEITDALKGKLSSCL